MQVRKLCIQIPLSCALLLQFVACFGEGFCPLRYNKDLPLMPEGQARVMFSCMLLALPKDISGIMRLQLGMFLIPSIGWDIAAEMLFMSTPISTRRCMPQVNNAMF